MFYHFFRRFIASLDLFGSDSIVLLYLFFEAVNGTLYYFSRLCHNCSSRCSFPGFEGLVLLLQNILQESETTGTVGNYFVEKVRVNDRRHVRRLTCSYVGDVSFIRVQRGVAHWRGVQNSMLRSTTPTLKRQWSDPAAWTPMPHLAGAIATASPPPHHTHSNPRRHNKAARIG